MKESLHQIDTSNVPPLTQSQTVPKSHVVLLPGSTRALGTYILESLQKPSVRHIHCLDRKSTAATIQQQKQALYNLPCKLSPSRVTFWQANLSQPTLGLNPDTLSHLKATTTIIIHNAWNVNFNTTLSGFKPDLQSVTNLINFTASSRNAPHLFFLSSISSIMGHKTDSRLIPEEVVRTTCPTTRADRVCE